MAAGPHACRGRSHRGGQLVNNSVASPQQPVREYLDALQKGEGEQGAGPAARLRAAQQRRHARRHGPADGRLAHRERQARRRRGRAAATRSWCPMEYTIDGSRLRTEFLLESTGTEWLFFHKWAFVPRALPIAGRHRGELQRGHPQRRPGEHARRPQLLRRFLPWRIRGLPQRPVLRRPAHPRHRHRPGCAGRPAEPPDRRPPTQLKEAVARKVKEFLDSCAAEADKQQQLQPDCPFYHATNNRWCDGTIKWSITEYPKITIEPFGGRWVVAPLDGKARSRPRQLDLFTGAVAALNASARLQLHHPPGRRRRHHQGHAAPELLGPYHGAAWTVQARGPDKRLPARTQRSPGGQSAR